MALQKEIWINSIIEGLFNDNTFVSKSVDHSGFVNNKTVHVPNAGAGPNVVKNRSTLPAAIGVRADLDLDYQIDEFTTDPIRLESKDVELSYAKRESVIRVARATLSEEVHKSILASWLSGAGAVTPETKVKDTVVKCKEQFDKDNIPAMGRFFLLDATTYNSMLKDMSDSTVNNFLSGADPVNGVLGKWMGFSFFMRSTLDGTKNGFAWWSEAVSRALGNVDFFDNQKQATYYADVMSFLVRAGGSVVRKDGKGVLAF